MKSPKENLAEISVRIGVNLQPGQELFINSPVETADFARMIAKSAFDAGAKDVHINYQDEKLSKLRYENADTETLVSLPDWFKMKYDEILQKNGAVISIHASDPDLLSGIDQEKILASVRAREEAAREYSDAIMADDVRWCVISVPTESWAKKVFPNSKTPVDDLWEAIFKTTYTDQEDPVSCWKDKDRAFKERAKKLNDKQYKALKYKNGRGTDITVGLPKGYIFSGGSEKAKDGVEFFPNLPTEELFSAPDKDQTNGTLASAYPLVYNGKIIDNFTITFKDGKVSDFTAEIGEDALDALIHVSEGSDHLGEVALVPYDSAISNMGLLFYNTLFDENASCHFALGAAYPTCVEGGGEMSPEELKKAGLNQSPTHVDFMVGTEDLEIVGVLDDGTEEKIFEHGNFVI